MSDGSEQDVRTSGSGRPADRREKRRVGVGILSLGVVASASGFVGGNVTRVCGSKRKRTLDTGRQSS